MCGFREESASPRRRLEANAGASRRVRRDKVRACPWMPSSPRLSSLRILEHARSFPQPCPPSAVGWTGNPSLCAATLPPVGRSQVVLSCLTEPRATSCSHFSQRLRRRAWLSRHARYSTHARRRTLTVARPSLATNPLRVSPLPDVAAEIALLECPPLACCTPHRSR